MANFLPVPSGPVNLFGRQNLPVPQNQFIQQILIMGGTGPALPQLLGQRSGGAANPMDCCDRLVPLIETTNNFLFTINATLERLLGQRVGGSPAQPPTSRGFNWWQLGQQAAAIPSPSMFHMLGQGLRTLGTAFAATPAGPVFRFEAALVESVDRLREFARNLLDAQFQIGEFSAEMRTVQAQQQLFDISRSQRRGAALAPSTLELAESLESLNKTLEGPSNLFQILLNKGVAKTVGIVEQAVKVLIGMNAGIAQIAALMVGEQKEATNDLNGFIERQQKDYVDWASEYGLPERFRIR